MLSDFDKRLLNELQNGLPLKPHPFAIIADRIGSDEPTVLMRLKQLKEAGYIRRIGAFFDSAALGYTGTLVALKVRPELVAEVAEVINRNPGVTHNYERDGEYNLWFTLQTGGETAKAEFLQQITALNGVQQIMELPVEKKYKIRVNLPLKGDRS